MKQIGLGRLSTVLATLVVIGLATSASAAPSGSCPSLSQNLKAYSNVGAFFTNSGEISTYTFFSVTTENPANGVPGLIKYCVYPDPAAEPDSISVSYDSWISGIDATDFMFGRPGGNKTNIPLDGKTVEMGTATWTTLPTDQIILLHIADSTACKALYGGNPSTCFVLPRPGPVCNVASSDETNAAYNAIPRDAVNCGPPSHAFEATQTKEFGDEVGLAKSGTLDSLTVLFNSYACEDFPLWNNSLCTTENPADTFSQQITANIYAVGALDAYGQPTKGALLATATQTFNIPFRPSADTQNCGTTGAFFNPISGNCEFSKKVLLTFNTWGATPPSLSGNVIWTVAFGTSTNGGLPVPDTTQCRDGGCPYDSLNVGTKTFPGAPYVGTDVDTHAAFINSTWNGIYCDDGAGGTGFLRASTNPPTPCTNTEAVNNYSATAWLDYKPLATIKVK